VILAISLILIGMNIVLIDFFFTKTNLLFKLICLFKGSIFAEHAEHDLNGVQDRNVPMIDKRHRQASRCRGKRSDEALNEIEMREFLGEEGDDIEFDK
jgi:hypothetical protein